MLQQGNFQRKNKWYCVILIMFCVSVFVGDVADGVKEVAMRKTSKCEVDKDKK